MNIVDKIYYCFYCLYAGPLEAKAQAKGEEFSPPYLMAKISFSAMTAIYAIGIIGLTNRGFHFAELTRARSIYFKIVIIVLLFMYLSGKENKIVDYYWGKRILSRRKDARIAFFIVALSVILAALLAKLPI